MGKNSGTIRKTAVIAAAGAAVLIALAAALIFPRFGRTGDGGTSAVPDSSGRTAAYPAETAAYPPQTAAPGSGTAEDITVHPETSGEGGTAGSGGDSGDSSLSVAAPGTSVSPGITTDPNPPSTADPPLTTVRPHVTAAPPDTSSPPLTTVSPHVSTSSQPVSSVAPPITTVSPPVTTVSPPVTTVSPPVTASPPSVTTSSPPAVSTPSAGQVYPVPEDTAFPLIEYDPPVPAGHTHSYAAAEVFAPSCEYGGYTKYRCECGMSELRDFTRAAGHKNSYAAFYRDGAGGAVMLVSCCSVCGKITTTLTGASGVATYGIAESDIKPGPSGIRFSVNGKSVEYVYEPVDTTNYICPPMPADPSPLEFADITALPKVSLPELRKNDRTRYPVTAVMRDGSTLDCEIYVSAGEVTLKVIPALMDIPLGGCEWGFAFNDVDRCFVYGYWIHPQYDTWLFTVRDYDPAFR